MTIRNSDTLKGLKKDLKKLLVEYWKIKRKRKINRYIHEHDVRCLHIGSDISFLEGWLCSDIYPRNKTSIYLDATQPFPFNDNTFDNVYSEHMIEHIPQTAGSFMMHESFRILKKGGKIRIATTDLERIINLYCKESEGFGKEYIRWITDRFIENSTGYSAAAVVNKLYHGWGHCFLYDEVLLTSALMGAGFSNIKRYRAGMSGDEKLTGIESHHLNVGNEEMVEFETMVLEAEK